MAKSSHSQVLGELANATVVHAGSLVDFLRAQDRQGRPWLLRQLKSGRGKNAIHRRFLQGYEHLQRAQGVGVARVQGLFSFQGLPCVALDEAQALPLQCCLETQPWLHNALRLGIDIAEGLDKVHSLGLVHGDVSPSTILWDAALQRACLCGLDYARPRNEDPGDLPRNRTLEVDPACMPPELTGRLNRFVDVPSDLYALGTVLYRLLAGSHAFQATDTLGWMHAHVAQRPRPLHELRPAVPLIVSQLVDRLLEKMPEQRYQSAWSLRSDLQRCLQALEEGVAVPVFALGADDFSGQLRQPSRLYGREAELTLLDQALEDVQQGACVGVSISGYAGIGKSALVRGMHGKLRAQGGYFVSGKTDQFQRQLPYSALTQALELLIATVHEDEDRVDPPWLAPLVASLGEDLHYLSVLAPSLAEWAGVATAPLAVVPVAPDVRARFCRAAQTVLQTFARPDAPLVLVLDDLQWADQGTLEVLEQLLLERNLRYTMLVLTHHDNGIEPGQALPRMLDALRARDAAPLEIALKALDVVSITEWLDDVLQGADQFLHPLALLIARKTAGNPFFIQRFLAFAVQQDWLRFDRAVRQWTWDAEAIRSGALADNVVEMLLSQMQRLPPDHCKLLATAAVLGNAFQAGEAGALQSLTPAALWPMVERLCALGYIRNVQMGQYAFNHDRIQEAACRLLDATTRRSLHARFAARLQRLPSAKRERRLYELLEHLHASLSTDSALRQRLDYAELALQASVRALQANAHAQGRQYAQHALALMAPSAWEDAPDLAFALHNQAQQGAYLCADFDDAQVHYAELLAHARAPLEMVSAHLCSINLLTMRCAYAEATQLGLQALGELGVPFDLNQLEGQVSADLERYCRLLEERGKDAICAYNAERDPRFEAVLALMGGIALPTFFSTPLLAVKLALRAAIFGINYRQTRSVAFLWSIISGAFVAIRSDYRAAAETTRFAMQLAHQQGNDLQYAQAGFIHTLALQWTEPLADVLAESRKSHALLDACGVLPLAGFTFLQILCARLEMGEPLGEVALEADRALDYAARTGNGHGTANFAILRQAVAALQGRTRDLTSLQDAQFDEAQHLASLGQNQMARALFHTTKLMLANHAQDLAGALEHARAGAPLMGFLLGFLASAVYHLHAALAWASAAADDLLPLEQALPALDTSLVVLLNLTQITPVSFGHKADLVQAERAAISGQSWLALELYELALRGARSHGFVQDEALIAARAARFCKRHYLLSQAQGFEHAALGAYGSWGATGLLPTVAHHEPSQAVYGPLDLESILKSAEAIRAELQYDTLLRTLLSLVMENAGAEQAVLLRPNSEGVLVAEAWLTPGALGPVFGLAPQATPPMEPVALALRMVLQSARPQVFSDALQDHRLGREPEVRARQVRSVLCVPLVVQQQVSAVLYLENNLAPGMFTDRQVRVLGIMAGQAAIALESARLYRGMEQEVRQRTQELEQRNTELALEVQQRQAAQLHLQQTQAALAAAQRFAQAIVEQAPYAVWAVAPDGRITVFNQQASRMTGHRADAVTHNSQLSEWLFPDPAYRQEVDLSLAEDQAEGFATRPATYRISTQEGTHRWMQYRVSTLDDGTAVFFGNDVSLLYEQAKQLEWAKLRAEESTHAKGEFLANMSHEIRTPMNAVIGLSLLALKNEMPPRIRDYLTKIQQSGEHLLGIINDILDFSKIESGKLDIESVPFDLYEVIDNLVNLVSEKAESKGLELLCSVAPGTPHRLIGDPLRMGQILINYAINAIKFTAQGEVRLTVGVLHQSEDRAQLHFELSDTGIGLTEDQIGRLFRSFAQADASTTRAYGGSGLGLAISRSLAQAMGGEVGVRSVEGEGSTFWFTLGLKTQGPATETPPEPRLQGLRTLVVEDNAAAGQLVSALAGELGLAADWVASGSDALARLAAAQLSDAPYQLALVDQDMPGLDGLHTVSALHAAQASGLPCVLMVHTHRHQEVLRAAEALGVRQVLSKPVQRAALLHTVLQALGLETAPPTPRGLPQSPLEQALAPLRGARILLVEDNEVNQLVASGMLRIAGFVVDLAPNGEQALAQIARSRADQLPYDLVLMDMQMPVMDGLTATRLIRQDPATDGLPIVAMTANAMQADRERCLLAGMNDFVTKPIHADTLWQALVTWITPRPGLGAQMEASPPPEDPIPAEWAPLMAALATIAELDVLAGMERTLNQAGFYVAMLRKFVSGQADAASRLQACLDQGDPRGAELIAHTLKSVAGNLGALPLQDSANQLERALRQGASPRGLEAAMAHTRGALESLLNALRDTPGLAPEAATPRGPLEPAEQQATAQVLEQIRGHLAHDDASAVELWEAHAPALRALLPGWAEVEAAIQAFDFDQALALLGTAEASR